MILSNLFSCFYYDLTVHAKTERFSLEISQEKQYRTAGKKNKINEQKNMLDAPSHSISSKKNCQNKMNRTN